MRYMAMTLRLPQADDQLLTERAAHEGRSKHELVVEAVHAMLTERNEFFDRMLNHGIADNAELLDRLAR